MICPNCQIEMEDKSYSFWSIGDWDSETPSGCYVKYIYPKCKTRYEGEYQCEKWVLSKNFKLPSTKQENAIKFINHWLGTNEDAISAF